MIWFREIWRSKLKFGLLAAAVGLLFFLLLFVNTLSTTLLDRFVGAVQYSSADLLVFHADAQSTVQASRLTDDDVTQVGQIDGVSAAGPIAVMSIEAMVGSDTINMSLWGIEVGGPGSPTRINGSLPQADEAIIDETAASDTGLHVGSTFELSGTELRVVGIADRATYAVLPTVYIPIETWEEIFAARYPDAPVIPINMVGVAVEEDAEPLEVAAAISASGALEVLTPSEAAASTPGASSISQSFTLITGITFAIVIVVVGFFFLILTVQKLKVFALLEAVGSRTRSLAGYVYSQIGFLVVLGIAIGVGMLAGATVATKEVFAIAVDPILVGSLGAAVLAASLACGVFSVRRILKQDAAQVATGGKR